MKKHFTGKQKAQIILELLKEEKTVAQIASEYSVHPNQLYRWKNLAVEGLPDLFGKDNKAEKTQQAAHERKLEELYSEIGKLTTQLAWLKKKSGIEPFEK